MNLKLKIYFSALIFILLIPAPSAQSAEIENVFFEDSLTVDETRLSARGTGLYRYLVVIKAYVGVLYVEEGKSTGDVLSNTAKRLELEYFHAIDGEDFGHATNKVIGQNTDSETLAKLQPRIEAFNALYRDVEPGDRYALTYIPGRGTELALNGTTLGVIKGEDFASAIYAMWLGREPMNKSFKRQLMKSP
ncbi:MAG: chalcone isomerase family protein [Desulfobacterales bacterium]|nr:chalcone isomerase family protein [Desulfobacterales bacterium]